MLLMLRRSGLSFAQIGRRLGKTSRSVASRCYRTEGIVFHYRKQKIARAQAAEARAAARAARERVAKSLLDRIGRGEAIMRVKQEGHSFSDLGAALGVSRQAVHQAMRAWKEASGHFGRHKLPTLLARSRPRSDSSAITSACLLAAGARTSCPKRSSAGRDRRARRGRSWH